MALKMVMFLLVAAFLFTVLWASDKITYEGERTIYTVRCENGTWDGLLCNGTMVAGDRYRFKASKFKHEVLYWIVGSPIPSAKYSNCTVKDRGNWSCEPTAGESPTIAHEMVNGRPIRASDMQNVPFHAVPKWVWWVVDSGFHVYSRAGY